MANKWDFWLAEQRKLIDDGAAVARVVLEGSDQTVWGTWPIGAEELDRSLEGILNSLREQLPKGKHSFRLLAHAADGTQLAVFPLTIAGVSPDASDPGQAAMNQQKAFAVMIGNFETAFGILGKQLEHVATLNVKASEGNVLLLDKLEQIQTRMSSTMGQQIREERRDERLGKMLETMGPLLELGVEFIATTGQRWLQERTKTPGEKPGTGQLPAAAVQSAHEQPATPPAGNEPPGSRPAGSDPQPSEPDSDGQGRTDADRESDSPRSGHPAKGRRTGTVSEPKRTTR